MCQHCISALSLRSKEDQKCLNPKWKIVMKSSHLQETFSTWCSPRYAMLLRLKDQSHVSAQIRLRSSSSFQSSPKILLADSSTWFFVLAMLKEKIFEERKNMNTPIEQNEYFTKWCRFLFLPIGLHVIPGYIGSQSVQGWQFRFLCSHEIAMMLEGDYIARLWVPSLHKFVCARWGIEQYTIWPY